MIITFEGGEGVGKTTQSRLLCSFLESRGIPTVSFREPGGCPLSENIRDVFFRDEMDVMTELLLVLASRRQNILEVINPAIDSGRAVVIDRFVDSTLVYQGIAGKLGLEKTRRIMEMTGTWIEPDLTFVLDCPPQVSVSRIAPADLNRIDRRDSAFHLAIRDAFGSIAGGGRYHLVDSTMPRDDVAERIAQTVIDFPGSGKS